MRITKGIIARGALATVVAVTGFSMFLSKPVAVVSAGESNGPENKNSTFFKEDQITEDNQKRLVEAQAPRTIDKSLERENLNRRIDFMNDENRVGYVYLLADTGQVIAEYTIKGKPSSLNSFITQEEQIRCKYPDSSGDKGCAAISSPDMDGSYGDNAEGIFFFTTDNNYVEWSGKYVYSS
jgi:hypothetical protein